MIKYSLSDTLKRLMFEKGIKATELARQTHLPQPTIQRMIAGTCLNPHLSSLVPIANFFNITLEQLKGIEPIPGLVNTAKNSLIEIPILTCLEAMQWPGTKSQWKDFEKKSSLWVENKISSEGFALTIEDSSMYPLFPKDTLVIVDPQKAAKDRCYVVAALKNHSAAIFRQLIIDVDRFYLKPLNPDLEIFPMLPLSNDDRVCGVMVQARKNYDD